MSNLTRNMILIADYSYLFLLKCMYKAACAPIYIAWTQLLYRVVKK